MRPSIPTPLLLFLSCLNLARSWSVSPFSKAPLAKNKKTFVTNPTGVSASRRHILQDLVIASVSLFGLTLYPPTATAGSSLEDTLNLIQQAREQLSPVPDLIKQEKWDSVRAILITPPLSDCWAKTSRPLLKLYAEALGDAGKDELAALEAREEANSHLRYLDMAVYNNVFNPIKTEGESGATKLLIKSYYEDPINEYKASAAALDQLVQLASE
mmetsp:Transcript_20475/g.38833  ORF Transcript_20475/g.38833 Transcript_20475/m.38833 type:complete len:214 (-) Transcript_20475:164-805(-)|eukprot:scaffold34595_cov160-Amphora_coffeaeformis.AAC.2